MEAVPRLPMTSFELLTCAKKISFTHKIEKYINGYYHEDPSSYHTEIQALDSLRISAVWPSVDVLSCQSMKKYYSQLHYMKSRFPMEENQPVALQFSWKDEYTKMSCTVPDVGFEEMCVLFNIGALHSKLGTVDGRSTPEGMKMACTHFQCAAWAFQIVREQYAQYVGLVIANIDIVRAMELMCLAQAQECILEKSLLDNRKAAVVVKVAAELSNFYFKAHKLLVAGDDAMLYEHLLQNKYLVRYMQFKISYYRCVSLLYAGQQAEEQQQMGARVAYYQAALVALEEARGCISRMPGGSQQQAPFTDTITFTWDVVEGKRKAAVNENEFIYHEEVPQVAGPGFELKGASLVKGIPFCITDIEVSGPDIFARLIPMIAHEASSIYSEQKASLLRYVADEIEKKDDQLQEFMSAINVEFLTQAKHAKGLTQELVDRAADMNARPEALKDLVEMMAKLSDIYHEVESLLSDIQEKLKHEENTEKEYQSIMGKRPQSNVLIELRREAVKYQEAHSRASESNYALHKAMTCHMANLKILAQPLNKLQEEIPSITLPDSNIDDEAIQKLEILLAKVEEMKSQRAALWTQFRDEMHMDDITPLLVTTDLDMDELFKTEMKKHNKRAELIKQNVAAQENIKNALTGSYAALSDSRKYIENIINKRNISISSIIASYDSYSDLKAKAQKGVEFYSKLENNVTKLHQRVRSTCKVQQEEREQLLITAGVQTKKSDLSFVPTGPKLTDFLDKRESNTNTHERSGYDSTEQINKKCFVAYPGVRPVPVGADSIPMPSVSTNESVRLQNNDELGLKQDLASRTMKLSIADQYWPGGCIGPDSSTTSAYNRNSEIFMHQQAKFGLTAVDKIYEFNSNSTNSNRQSQVCSMPIAGAYGYNSTSTNILDPALNKNTKLSDLSRYPYSTTCSTGPPTSPAINTRPIHIQPNQVLSLQGDPFQSSNSTAIPALNHSGYIQLANNDNSVSVHSGVAGNIHNSAGYTNAYSSYNMLQTNVSDAAASYENCNSINTIPQHGIPYNAIPIQQPSYPIESFTSYNQSQPNLQVAPNTSLGQPVPFTPEFPYNTNNLPWSSIQTATTTSSTFDPRSITSQGITSGYTTAGYIHSDIPSIKSHVSGNVTTNSSNYYGEQPTLNCYGNYLCQTTAGYNYYNLGGSQLGQNQAVKSIIDAHPRQLPSPKQIVSINKPSLHTEISDIKKVSSIDLLSGLDFSLKQAPLVPQKESQKTQDNPALLCTSATKEIKKSITKTELANAALCHKKTNEKPPKKEPFKSSAIVLTFTKYAQEFWNLTDSLAVDKALSALWKELQDNQESANVINKRISVARCYPLKNRCPDILPYDYSRVELLEAKDDYINASKVYDLHEYVPNFIVTQAPLRTTLTDFWDMIWERNVEAVVCLLSDSELGDIYWPTLQSNDLNIGNKVITLQNTHVRSYSTERRISIHIPEKREFKYVNHYQFTSWIGSMTPANSESFLAFTNDVLVEFETQKSHLNPILVHCDSGIGRSGCFCTVLSVMGEVHNTGHSVNVIQTISRIAAMRKNIMRDRQHLKFTYNTVALFYKGLVKVDNTETRENDDPIALKENTTCEVTKLDPLSTLDPLWATRK